MVNEAGKSNGKARKRPRLKYFFLNGDLHRKIVINRGRDLLSAWNYPKGKKVSYSYSDTLRHHEPAFTTQQVAQMVNRHRVVVQNAVDRGMIEQPQFTYGLDQNRHKASYMWHEKDIMALHEYLAGIHYGRPRKDGEITPKHLPTPRELRAMIHNEEILYVKQGDTFVPSWRAKEF
jgi:hypothetical protein